MNNTNTEAKEGVKLWAYLPKGIDVLDLVSRLSDLKTPSRPVYYGEDERPVRKSQTIEKSIEFGNFVSHNSIGFFLFSGDGKVIFDIGCGHGEYTTLRVSGEGAPQQGDIIKLEECIAKLEPDLVICCQNSEYKHRNRLYFRYESGSIESWIGRNPEKGLPGIYWRTTVSLNYLKRHQIDINAVTPFAHHVNRSDCGSLISIQMFEHAHEWTAHAEQLDVLCENVEGIFSRAFVDDALKGLRTMKDYRTLMSKLSI